MRPIDFPGVNFTWLGDGGAIIDLPVKLMPHGESICCLQLDADELAEVVRTGVLWVHVLGRMPPIMVSAFEPPDIAFARAEQTLPADFAPKEPVPS